MGNMVFSSMVDTLNQSGITFARKITPRQYRQWKKLYTWDALRNLRYGQSFCNHFEISDHRLFYERNQKSCDNLIQKEYLS